MASCLGGIIGGPVGTYLIEKQPLHADPRAVLSSRTVVVAASVASPEYEDEDASVLPILKNLVVDAGRDVGGRWVSRGFAALGLTLPAYIGAMLVAAVIRNIDDKTGWLGLSQRFIDEFGAVALSLFLVLALMTLKLWELAGLALAAGLDSDRAGDPGGAGLPSGRCSG